MSDLFIIFGAVVAHIQNYAFKENWKSTADTIR